MTDTGFDLYERGRSALAAGRHEEAAELFQRSVAVDPHFKTLELLGEALLLLGRHKDAVVPLAAATTLNRQVRAPAMLAEALLALGDELQAHEIATLALGRSPANKQALAVLERTADAYERWRDTPSTLEKESP